MKNTIYIILPLLAAALAAGALGQGQPQATAAVMTLNCTGLSGADAEFLSERLMIELARTGRFEVLERTKRDEVLKERDFQMSGACDAAACLAEAGRLLAVNKAVGGSVGQLGQVISVQVKLVDIATGVVEATAVRDYRGGLELLLTSGMREVARELAGLARPQPADSVAATARLSPVPALTAPIPRPGSGQAPAAAKKYPRPRPTSGLKMPGVTYGSWAMAAGLGILSYIYHHQAQGYTEISQNAAPIDERDRMESLADKYGKRSKTAGLASLGFAGLGTATAFFRTRPAAGRDKAEAESGLLKVAFHAGPDGIGVTLVGRM